MFNITSIVTRDVDYLKGFQFVQSLGEVVKSNINVILDEASDPDSFKPAFTKASLHNDVQELVFTKPVSLIKDSITTEDDFVFTDCTMVLSRDSLQNRVAVALVDDKGNIIDDDANTGATFFLEDEDVSTACKMHQDLDRNGMIAGGQRITGDHIPLIKLIEKTVNSTIIANDGDALKKMSDYIYHAVLGERLEAFIQRGLEAADKPAVSYAPTPYFH